MRLSDLEPSLVGTIQKGQLRFRCPMDGCPLNNSPDERHWIVIPIGDPIPGENSARWQASGVFPDSLTLSPSINEHLDNPDGTLRLQGWHGFIQHGEAK